MEFESEEARRVYFTQQLDHHFGHLEPDDLMELMDLVGHTYLNTIGRVHTDRDAVALEVADLMDKLHDRMFVVPNTDVTEDLLVDQVDTLLNAYGSDELAWKQRISEWRRKRDIE